MTASRKALAADFLVIALFAAGTLALLNPDLSFRIVGFRVTMPRVRPTCGLRSSCRQNWIVPRPPSFAWLLVPFRRSTRARFVREAREPLALDERALDPMPPSARTIGGFALVVLGLSALVIVLMWPQVRQLRSVSDLGDPLFSIWRLAWVSHQLPRAPFALFDSNQFHPERLTLTYSDSMLVPALIAAPFFWVGVHPVVVYNILLLSSFVASGVAMFLLVRALTGRIDAALVGGTLFAFYPYRFEHYSHLELLMTMWMPLALLGLHRTIAGGRLRDGLATGLTFALQTLSSLYYGCFLAVYMFVLGVALWLGRGRPRKPIRALVAGGALAAVLIAPVASQYLASRPMMGLRDEAPSSPTVPRARLPEIDFSQPALRTPVRGARQAGTLSPAHAVDPAWHRDLAAALGGANRMRADVSALGGRLVRLHGPTFTALHAVLLPFRGLRVPARFGLLAGMTLAILSGYGGARLLERWPRRHIALAGAMLALVIVEALLTLRLQRVWDEPLRIYASIAGAEPPVLLAEFPMRGTYTDPTSTRAICISRRSLAEPRQWQQRILPPSYVEPPANENDYPNEAALSYLRSREYRCDDARQVHQCHSIRRDRLVARCEARPGTRRDRPFGMALSPGSTVYDETTGGRQSAIGHQSET